MLCHWYILFCMAQFSHMLQQEAIQMSVFVPIILSIAAILRGLPPLQMYFSIFKSPGRDKYVTLSERDSVRLWMLWICLVYIVCKCLVYPATPLLYMGMLNLIICFVVFFYGSIKLEKFNLQILVLARTNVFCIEKASIKARYIFIV